MLIAPSNSYRVGAFLTAGHDLGCDLVVATDAASAIDGASVHVAFDDPSGAANQLLEQVGAIDGVVGTDGAAVAVAAAVARIIGGPTNSLEAMRAAGDKHAQRQAASGAGVPQPDFVLVDATATSWTSFPAVVKPLDRSASQGVVRVDSPEDLIRARARVGQIVGGGPLLVESFVPGTEVAVEGLLHEGRLEVLALFDKPDTPEGPTFPETLLVSPARLDRAQRAQVIAVAEAALSAIGLAEGPIHLEVKVDGTDVWFLEVAARTIGGSCSRALDLGGVALEERVIRHALGLSGVVASPVDPTATGVLMLPVPATGTVEAVRGVDVARAVPGVTEVVLSVSPGQRVEALPAGDRYLGFVFARAGTADDVELALRAAWDAIDVDVSAW